MENKINLKNILKNQKKEENFQEKEKKKGKTTEMKYGKEKN
jgi:hypothetical protein